MSRMAKVGIWLDSATAEKRWRYGENVFGLYLEEVLSHAGLPFVRLDSADALDCYEPDILLAALSGESDSSLQLLEQYIQRGGTLISYAGLNRMAESMGCREIACRDVVYADFVTGGGTSVYGSLRSASVKPWIPFDSADGPLPFGVLHKGHPGGEFVSAAWLEFQIGKGKLIRWNVNIPETIVILQQGSGPVVEDGIPAPDGTGNLDEGLLKADDRCEMDWELDRRVTDTGYAYFSVPYADFWRERLVSQVLTEASGLGLALPFVDYWPDGISQIALISHDSDFNIDDSAEATLDVLKECGVQSTWCMIEPGFSQSMYERIRKDGHELAFHYNALEQEYGTWSRDEFERQLGVIRSTAMAEIRTNKNHYTRFEGWGELFQWCEVNGIEGDQTRGPSKKGNIGFLFGTCHPYYPIACADERNRLYNVLEIGFLTQDLDHTSLADSSVIDPFLSMVASVRGVAHFLFHQMHILQQPKVKEALRTVIHKARELGFAFWTSDRIVQWEKSRRQIVLSLESDGRLRCENAPPGAVLWMQVTGNDCAPHDTEVRFGVICRKMIIGDKLSSAF